MNALWSPFAALGLPPDPGKLTDDDVRSAWRRIAAATHPDREDGGDPDRYRDASRAYALLRTAWGRTEAWADLQDGLIPGQHSRTAPPPPRPAPVSWRGAWQRVAVVPARLRHGSPRRLAIRILAAAALATGIWYVRAGTPATAALLVGIGTWLVRTAPGDLAPPPGR
ncbi:MAG: J domain-containing protein [Streptosporangiaceae bacterium]